jgi:CYTH domain-containing protein
MIEMSVENERKLLLDLTKVNDLLDILKNSSQAQWWDITQSYLPSACRIRHCVPHFPTSLQEEHYLFTYKVRVNEQTIEIETTITKDDYEKLKLITWATLHKTRAKIIDDDLTWDIDFFRSNNEIYLNLAEVEMPEHQLECPVILPILKPYAKVWISPDDSRFNNVQLCNRQIVKQLLNEFS